MTFSTEDLESTRGQGVGSFRIGSPREAVSGASLSCGRTLGKRSPVVATLVRVGQVRGSGGALRARGSVRSFFGSPVQRLRGDLKAGGEGKPL